MSARFVSFFRPEVICSARQSIRRDYVAKRADWSTSRARKNFERIGKLIGLRQRGELLDSVTAFSPVGDVVRSEFLVLTSLIRVLTS